MKQQVINYNIMVTDTTSLADLVLPDKANIDKLPKTKDLSLHSILLEQRRSYNSLLDVLDVVVRELKEIKKQGKESEDKCKQIEERIIPEVKQSLKLNLETIENKTVDLQGHGFRLNLICRDKDELEDETPAQTEQLFKDVLKEHLKIDNTDGLMFRAVHRLPKPKTGKGKDKPKPIIAAFIKQSDRDNVLSKAHMLKDTGLSLQSHLPKKLNDLRNDMLKARRTLLQEDRSKRIRVVDKNFTPVLQEFNLDADRWQTIRFPIEDEADETEPRRRGGRRGRHH